MRRHALSMIVVTVCVWLLAAGRSIGEAVGKEGKVAPKPEPERSRRSIHIRPRYYRLYTDPGVEEAEANYRYATLDWHVPLDEAALVLVDVWEWSFARDTRERMEKIVRGRIAPLLAACRRHGLQVIHAPAWPVATKHPNWVRLVDDPLKRPPRDPSSPDWPPEEFRKKRGRYAAYARPFEPQQKAREEHRDTKRTFHPLARPVGDEAVVVNGEELHRLCAKRGIKFLFYAGFYANMCIERRDYAPYAMMPRGYECILLRDCTTGMETHETQADLVCTRGAIATLEQDGAYTLTAEELVSALQADDKQ